MIARWPNQPEAIPSLSIRAMAEGSVRVLLPPVGRDVLHLRPLGSVDVVATAGASDAEDLVAGAGQTRDKEGADVAAATNDDDSYAGILPGAGGRSTVGAAAAS